MDNTDRKLFILDTNVLLHEPLAIYSFKEHDVLIPMTVLEELDNIKDRQKDVSRDARVAIRALEDVFRDANPEQIVQGVALAGEASVISPSSAITICPRMPRCSPTRRRTTASSTRPSTCKSMR